MDENKEPNITKSAGRGAVFQIAGGGAQTVIRIGASTILARILMPEDFGLFGMALLLSELVLCIGAFGVGTGIIAKQNVTEDDLSTAFWIMAAIRIVIFSFAYLFAPFLAGFFDEPRIISVIRAISFTFLFQICGVIGNTLLKKRLKYLPIFIITVSSSLLESGLAIVLVLFYRQDYWALVLAMVAASFWNNAFVFFMAGWRPTFRFNKESYRFLFRYGINSLGSSVTEYFKSNADYFIIGKMLGPKALGFYEFAYRIPFLIESRIAIPLREIMFPALAMVNTSNERLASGYIKGVKYIALVCFPALGGLAVIAQLMVKVLWGDQWLPIVAPLQILCFACAIKSTANPVFVTFICKDRPDIPFKFSFILLFFTIAVVSIFGYFFGMQGIAWAMLLSTIPILILVFYSLKMLRTPISLMVSALWPVFISTGVTMIMAYGFQRVLTFLGLPQVIVLAFSILAGALAYVASLRLGFKKTFEEILETISVISGVKFNLALKNT